MIPRFFQKGMVFAMAAATFLSATPAAFAIDRDLDNLIHKPAVRQAAIGAAIGAAGGLLTDRTTVGRGAVTGAVVGAGSGLLTQSRYFRYRPLARNTVQGALIGAGTGYATGRENTLKGALLGAGAGAGYHYVRRYLDTH